MRFGVVRFGDAYFLHGGLFSFLSFPLLSIFISISVNVTNEITLSLEGEPFDHFFTDRSFPIGVSAAVGMNFVRSWSSL